MKTFKHSSIFLCFILLLLSSARGFTSSTVSTNLIVSTLHTERVRESTTRRDEKPGWLDDAMEGIPSGEFDAESYENGINLQPGIAGFSVDPELGFVSILVTNNESASDQHWIPAVISPVDKDRPKSPEALTCVQLAGGLDLGTAILPPNTLAKLVADQIDEEEDESATSIKVDGSSTRLSLTKVTALPNPDAVDDSKISIEEETEEIVATTPERDQAILEAAPKLEKAVKSLPGLAASTADDVLKAVQRFANSKGEVDRTAFSSILQSLRESNNPSTWLASPLFRLEVTIIDGGGISELTVHTSDALIALGLSMRYKVTVDVENIDDHKQGGIGKDALLERFPLFRPIQELGQDSEIIDGFIPSMFNKAQMKNDMKEE